MRDRRHRVTFTYSNSVNKKRPLVTWTQIHDPVQPTTCFNTSWISAALLFGLVDFSWRQVKEEWEHVTSIIARPQHVTGSVEAQRQNLAHHLARSTLHSRWPCNTRAHRKLAVVRYWCFKARESIYLHYFSRRQVHDLNHSFTVADLRVSKGFIAILGLAGQSTRYILIYNSME